MEFYFQGLVTNQSKISALGCSEKVFDNKKGVYLDKKRSRNNFQLAEINF